jgi:hypothetical protein
MLICPYIGLIIKTEPLQISAGLIFTAEKNPDYNCNLDQTLCNLLVICSSQNAYKLQFANIKNHKSLHDSPREAAEIRAEL